MLFSRYCYADIAETTFISEIDGELKVNHMQTMHGMLKSARKAKTNKDYCFEFEDRPLQGVIDGKAWKAGYLVEEPFLSGRVHTIYADGAEPNEYNGSSFPKIMLFRFDPGSAEGKGGNFGDNTNITLYSPPGNNMSGLGSFRVSEEAASGYKLDIFYKHDDDNYVSGYLMVKVQN